MYIGENSKTQRSLEYPMAESTYIKGKDSDLESSISKMQASLKTLGFDVEEVSWLNPVSNCYSVHLRDRSCKYLFTNGKGATPKACLASALGEFFERLSCSLFFADYYLGAIQNEFSFVHYSNEKWFIVEDDNIPSGILDKDLWKYFDPENELRFKNLLDLNSNFENPQICTLPFTRLRDQKEIFFPVNMINNIFVSNGMSAGNTQYEARVQALSEIIERYVKNKIISEERCVPEVPSDVLKRFPNIMKSCNELEEHGFYVRIADASLGGVFPVMSVTLIRKDDGRVFAAFGAHPKFEVALERTVTELLQGKNLEQLDGFSFPTFDTEEVSSSNNLEMHFVDSSGSLSYKFFKKQEDYVFVDWNYNGSTKEEYEYLVDIIAKHHFDIYLTEYDYLGVYACRILIPGMSDIYPVEDLVWDNKNEGSFFRKSILNLEHLPEDQLRSLLEELDSLGYSDTLRVADFIGVIPNENTTWEYLCIGELKALLAIALQNQSALVRIQWCLLLEDRKATILQNYRCLESLLEIRWNQENSFEQYQELLEKMFGKNRVSMCLNMVNGKNCFSSIASPGLELDGFTEHQKLMNAYTKLHRAKAK